MVSQERTGISDFAPGLLRGPSQFAEMPHTLLCMARSSPSSGEACRKPGRDDEALRAAIVTAQHGRYGLLGMECCTIVTAHARRHRLRTLIWDMSDPRNSMAFRPAAPRVLECDGRKLHVY